jgi:hypothetical protein
MENKNKEPNKQPEPPRPFTEDQVDEAENRVRLRDEEAKLRQAPEKGVQPGVISDTLADNETTSQ